MSPRLETRACRYAELRMRALLAYELNSFSPGKPQATGEGSRHGAGSERSAAGNPKPPAPGGAVTFATGRR